VLQGTCAGAAHATPVALADATTQAQTAICQHLRHRHPWCPPDSVDAL